MLAPSERYIWDFAVAWYQMPGVEADCLVAQDTYGLDVTALIFALHRASQGQGFDASLSAELSRTLSARVTEPLRAARIAMKTLPRCVDPAASEALRQQIKAAELASEKLTLTALAAQISRGDAVSLEQAVSAIALASQAGSDPTLSALLKRLALAAQNM